MFKMAEGVGGRINESTISGGQFGNIDQIEDVHIIYPNDSTLEINYKEQFA